MTRKKEVAPQLDKLKWIEDQLRQALDEDKRLDEIIAKGPQIKTTATGYPALIFETCSCKKYADRRKDHSDDCTVEAVTDPSPIVAAMKEKRLNRGQVATLLSLREELTQPVDQSEDMQNLLSWIKEMSSDVQRLTEENEALKARLLDYQTSAAWRAEILS